MDDEKILNTLKIELKVDVQTVMDRFLNNTEMYFRFLKKLPVTEDFAKMTEAIQSDKYDEAFENAHALKGVTGNLGLSELYRNFCDIVDSYRANDTQKMKEQVLQIVPLYESSCKTIQSLITN